MEIQPAFLALAAGLMALALLLPLRAVWQGVDRQASVGTRRRAWLLTWAMVVGLPALSVGLYWLLGDPQALAPDRAELSEQYL